MLNWKPFLFHIDLVFYRTLSILIPKHNRTNTLAAKKFKHQFTIFHTKSILFPQEKLRENTVQKLQKERISNTNTNSESTISPILHESATVRLYRIQTETRSRAHFRMQLYTNRNSKTMKNMYFGGISSNRHGGRNN